jgi:hypothetical protein
MAMIEILELAIIGRLHLKRVRAKSNSVSEPVFVRAGQ